MKNLLSPKDYLYATVCHIFANKNCRTFLLLLFQGGKSAFSGFGGFSFKPTQTSTPLFSGGFFKTESKTAAGEKRKEEADAEKDDGESPTKRKKPDTNGSEQTDANGCSPERTTYLSNLKSLNVSVMNWISTHLEKNPYCILTPIFKDYDTHLDKLEKDKNKESNGSAANTEMKKEVSGKLFHFTCSENLT